LEPERDSQSPPLVRSISYLLFGAFGVWLFSKLRTPSDKPSGSSQHVQDGDHDAIQLEQNTASPIHVVVDAGPSTPTPNKNREAREERKEQRDEKRFRVEKVTALLLAVYTIVNGGMWWATKKSADAAKYAAETTAKQLELSERPWIKILDVQTTGDSPIIPALSFQQIGPYRDYGPYKDVSQQATFQLIISMKNIGHSVADVATSFELFFPLWDSGKYWGEISSEQKRFCDSPAGMVPQFYPKFVVFPGESFDWHGAAVGLIHSGVTNRLPNQGDNGYVLPVLIVCANYRLRPLNNSYQTRTIYEAFHAEDRTRFFKIGEGIPAKRILLMRNEMADDAY
jgi:hypothetical protein